MGDALDRDNLRAAERAAEMMGDALADAHDCGIDPEDPEREREEYIDQRIETWQAKHTKDPPPTRSMRRLWFLEGHDDGIAWTKEWWELYDNTPTLANFQMFAEPMLATRGLYESAYRSYYRQGLDAGYCDACDHFMADWAKMREGLG